MTSLTLQRTLLPGLFALALTNTAMANLANATEATPSKTAALTLKVYNADSNSFHVNSVLLAGERDAVLIDGQFTRVDAHRLVADILASQKNLTTIYISHGDPDYYFGLEVITQAFPQAKVVASQPTVDWIRNTVAKKVAFWGPKLGANGPQQPIIPSVLTGDVILLEGHRLEIKGLDSELPARSFVWVPDLRAVLGGVNVFAGLHLWTADTQTPELRAAWSRALERIAALQPAIVVPGHAQVGAAHDLSAVRYSQAYLATFERELAGAKDSAALIATMQQKYPDAGLPIALDIGAKVNTGEMKW
ncbi:MBL fold metallo-hydrolase [Permianibacter sp. IMCC34836]|uniref:MBL fold metallo-hydrolase n=1 Tax=Permianibacter fluminis TaxID=2738515 RepID=UPI0015557681|nr:MBL fold metallo-hydrolase [Permianibacter fluminis]NQD36731.1 MBL fold metallo-hydrolase [Permianibacter fluminis]